MFLTFPHASFARASALGAGIDAHVRAGVDRAADWLASAGYEIVDAEPPQIAEVNAAWFDVIGADFAGVWPLMQQIATPAAIEFVQRILESGVMKFVDQPGQAAAWIARHQLGAAWAQFSRDHPIVLAPVCCERPWLVDG